MICLLLLGLVVADLAWNGVYGQYGTWTSLQGESVQPLVLMLVFGVVSAGLLVGGVVAIGFHPTSARFLIEVEQEMVRVTWPPRSDVVRLTILIAVMAVILAGVIYCVDWFNLFLRRDVINELFKGAG